MRTSNLKMRGKFPKKSLGMKLNKPKPIPMNIPQDTDEFKEEEFQEVDLFTELSNQLDTIRGKRRLENFIRANKRDINSLNPSAKHSFLKLVKTKFF